MNSDLSTDNLAAPPVTFDYSQERGPIDQLIGAWKDEKDKCKTRRELRENKRNVQEERRRGSILEDETIIPDRTINLNIRRGRVPYINYVTGSKRILIITDVQSPEVSVEPLELWFTRGMRYPGWKTPWFRAIDCMHTHGGCAVEVVYDPNKPLGCGIEYIPRDSLIVPIRTRNLQACSRIARLYEITPLQLEEFTKQYSFSESISKDILDKFRKRDDFINIYRMLLKKDGIVYNAWYTQENTTDWLRAPEPHNIGLFDFDQDTLKATSMPGPMGPMPLVDANGQPCMLFASPMWELMAPQMAKPATLAQYPLFWFRYEETENEELLATSGRVALDLHVQEALTHTVTAFVNGCTRAAGFYPSAEAEPGADPALKELGRLKPGVVMSHKLATFQPAWPNDIMGPLVQMLDQRKAQETGKSDFAAIARKDANKTATEMNLALQESQAMGNTDIDVFSNPYLLTYTLCFKIATHQALFNLVLKPSDPSKLLGDYQLAPAGDIEVTKRQEDKQNAKEFFNIVQGTPMAEKIMIFLIERFFPDQAAEWIAALQGPDKDAVIQELLNIIQSIPTDELSPDQQSALRSVIATASGMVAQSGNQGVPGNPGQPQAGPPPSGHEMQPMHG